MSSIIKTLNIIFGHFVFGSDFYLVCRVGGNKKTALLSLLMSGKAMLFFVEAPNGNQILIDGGPNKAVLESCQNRCLLRPND